MTRVILIGILSSLLATPSFASCVYKDDISKYDESHYLYKNDCHREFGQTLKLNKALEEKIEVKDRKEIEYKNLIQMQKEYIELEKTNANNWKTSFQDLKKEQEKQEKLDSIENVLYFAGGVLATSLVVYLVK